MGARFLPVVARVKIASRDEALFRFAARDGAACNLIGTRTSTRTATRAHTDWTAAYNAGLQPGLDYDTWNYFESRMHAGEPDTQQWNRAGCCAKYRQLFVSID